MEFSFEYIILNSKDEDKLSLKNKQMKYKKNKTYSYPIIRESNCSHCNV